VASRLCSNTRPHPTREWPDPIVFLHGGPGLRFAPFDSDIYGSFAADGFRVYLYDQAGSGASTLFPHIRDYTVARAVEDLETIRMLRLKAMRLPQFCWSANAATYPGKRRSTTEKPLPTSRFFTSRRRGITSSSSSLSKVIRSFLLDQPDALAPYTADADPRPPAS
jgi:hypothetical protein